MQPGGGRGSRDGVEVGALEGDWGRGWLWGSVGLQGKHVKQQQRGGPRGRGKAAGGKGEHRDLQLVCVCG